MIIKNGNVFQEDGSFRKETLYIRNHRLTEAFEATSEEEVIDAEGLMVIPGLVDIHSHGAYGEDFSDGDPEGLKKILRYERQSGITSYCPTSMTLPKEQLKKIFKGIREAEKSGDGATVAGINMEGPFLDPVKKGAHVEEWITEPDADFVRELNEVSGGRIKLVTLAPNVSGAMEFIRKMQSEVQISLGHTAADYECASEAMALGAHHVTHLYNAMQPLAHREPGLIGAACDDEQCMAEMICDGIHIHPATVRQTFKMFGDDRIILISDSMEATGMPDGEYALGGQKVIKTGNLAALEDGTIAGSATNLMDCVRVVVQKMRIPLESAVKCAAVNSAKSVGIYDQYGSITPGKKANLVLLKEEDLSTVQVILRGQKL